jgi:Homeobox KN domain
VDHLQNPYLKPNDKAHLAQASGLTKKQVQNWFTNIRKVSRIKLFSPLFHYFTVFFDLKTNKYNNLAPHRSNDAKIPKQKGHEVNSSPSEAAH